MNRFLTIIFLAFLPIFSFSQKFEGGILGGFVVSQVDGDRLGGYDKPGITFGGFIKLKVKEKISIQTELKYIQKGSADYANPEKGDYSSYKLRLNYIEMPFILKYHYRTKISFDAGLGFAYLINDTENENNQGFVDAFPAYNNFEIPFICGASYQLTPKIEISGRFSWSILPIRPFSGGNYWWNRGQNNELLSLTFNYKFRK